jgi:hypothetical protein
MLTCLFGDHTKPLTLLLPHLPVSHTRSHDLFLTCFCIHHLKLFTFSSSNFIVNSSPPPDLFPHDFPISFSSPTPFIAHIIRHCWSINSQFLLYYYSKCLLSFLSFVYVQHRYGTVYDTFKSTFYRSHARYFSLLHSQLEQLP